MYRSTTTITTLIATHIRSLIALVLCVCSTGVLVAQDYDDSPYLGGRRVFSTEISYRRSYHPTALGQREWGQGYAIMGEYAFPSSHFALRGGYQLEHFELDGPSFALQLESLELGGRYYFTKPDHLLQPYVGLSAGWIFSHSFEGNSFGRDRQFGTHYFGSFSRPSFNVAPSVGVDIHLGAGFSLGLGYSYRSSIGSPIYVRSYVSDDVFRSSALGRHEVSLSLKVAFPRRWGPEQIGSDIFDMLIHVFDAIIRR